MRVRDHERTSLVSYGGCTGRVVMICDGVHLVSFGERGSRFYFRGQIAKLAA